MICSVQEEVELSRQGVSKGKILKTIQNRFGNDWKGLKKMNGISEVEINVTNVTLKLTGSLEGITNVRQIMS